MTEGKLIENLKTEKKKWVNKIYGVGETRIDLMIEDVIRVIQKLQEENKKYKYLYQKALDDTIQSDRENMRKDNIIDKISQNPFNELRVDGIRFCGTDIKQYFKKVSDGE